MPSPRYRFKLCWLAPLPGVVLGVIYGITQELRGTHFLSHDLSAILLCWVGYIVCRLVVGGGRLRVRDPGVSSN